MFRSLLLAALLAVGAAAETVPEGDGSGTLVAGTLFGPIDPEEAEAVEETSGATLWDVGGELAGFAAAAVPSVPPVVHTHGALYLSAASFATCIGLCVYYYMTRRSVVVALPAEKPHRG